MILSAKGYLEEDLSFTLQRHPSIKLRKTSSSETSVYTVQHQVKHSSVVLHQRDSQCERSCWRNWWPRVWIYDEWPRCCTRHNWTQFSFWYEWWNCMCSGYCTYVCFKSQHGDGAVRKSDGSMWDCTSCEVSLKITGTTPAQKLRTMSFRTSITWCIASSVN